MYTYVCMHECTKVYTQCHVFMTPHLPHLALSRYHLECLTPPLHAVPPGNWYCPTCGPILGILPDQWTAGQSSNAIETEELLVDSDEEVVCTDHYNLRPRHASVNMGDFSDEGVGPPGHAYHLRSSTIADHTASQEQRRSGCISLDSSGGVYFDSAAAVAVTVSNSGSDVHLNRADVTFTTSDNDTNESLQQQSTRRRRLQSTRMLRSSDEDTMLNVASRGSESDDGVRVRRKRNRRRKLPATLKSSESESEGEVERYASGSGVAEWFSAGEDGSSSEQSCESEASGWDVHKGKGPCGPQEDSEDGGSFNDASTISIHSGCGVASGSDVTGKGKSPYSPLVVEDKGVRATRKSRSKGKARTHPQRSCRKRRKLTAESAKRLSEPARKRRQVQVKRRTLKRKARKRVTMPIQPAKRRLVAGEPSGINSTGTVVSIPETPLAKRRLTHGSSHTHSTPTLTPQARVVASTPTSSLRQARVQQAVREYATTGSLPQGYQCEAKLVKSEMTSEDRMIEWWVQRKHSSPSWLREAVDRKKAGQESPSQTQDTKEASSPSWSWKSRETPSSANLSLGTPNRRHWKQAELRLPQINRRPLLGAQRCVGLGQ